MDLIIEVEKGMAYVNGRFGIEGKLKKLEIKWQNHDFKPKKKTDCSCWLYGVVNFFIWLRFSWWAEYFWILSEQFYAFLPLS